MRQPRDVSLNHPNNVPLVLTFRKIDDLLDLLMAKAAADANATVLMSNHSEFDMAYMKARMVSTMMPGEDNPFVIKDGVQRYQTVLVECAEAEKARLMEGQDIPSTQ